MILLPRSSDLLALSQLSGDRVAMVIADAALFTYQLSMLTKHEVLTFVSMLSP